MQFVSTIKNRKSHLTTKVFNRAFKADPKRKIVFKKFPTLLKKNKKHNAQPTRQ